jgi:hypothetical protein
MVMNPSSNKINVREEGREEGGEGEKRKRKLTYIVFQTFHMSNTLLNVSKFLEYFLFL